MPQLKLWYNSKGEIKSKSSGSVSETIAMYNTMSRYIKAQARAMIEAGNAALYPTADTAQKNAKMMTLYHQKEAEMKEQERRAQIEKAKQMQQTANRTTKGDPK